MGSLHGAQTVQAVTSVLPCASTPVATTGWLPIYVFRHCMLPVMGRSGGEMEQHDTVLSAWARGDGDKQTCSLEWTHDILQR